MENRPHAFVVGLFTLLLGLAIAGGALYLNRQKNAANAIYELTTEESVQGLSRDAAVRFRGVDIGRVRSIHFDPSKAGRIRIEIAVDPSAPLTRGSYGQLNYQGITGLAFIQLNDEGKDPRPLSSATEELPQIELRPSMFDAAQDIIEDTLKEADRLAGQLDKLLQDGNQAKLISLIDTLNATGAQLGQAAASADAALAKMPALIDSARSTLAHGDAMMNQLSDAVAQIEAKLSVLDAINMAASSLDKINNELSTLTLPRVNSLTDQASSGAAEFRAMIGTISDHPESLLLGAPAAPPGPGEPGFNQHTGERQ
jgi:phospholipid/cholesterol/gamma-HCH transport system substrate-binding protein